MKEDLRARMRALRAGLDPGALARGGRAVAERVLELPELRGGPVLCYVSVRRELPTDALVRLLLDRGVPVAVPRVVDGERMEARRWAEPLVPGPLGIPTSDGPSVDEQVAVALCPGLAFDRRGARLGYGKGFYDRWLGAHPSVLPIGLCLDEALLDEVPADVHDRRMAIVVTPTRVIRCGEVP